MIRTYNEEAEGADKSTTDEWLAATDAVQPKPRNEAEDPVRDSQASCKLQGNLVRAAKVDLENMGEVVDLVIVS